MVSTRGTDVRWLPPAGTDGHADSASPSMPRSRGSLASTARVTLVKTLVVVAVVAGALALWKLKILIALLFMAATVAAAMRPGVEALARRRVPRIVAILL